MRYAREFGLHQTLKKKAGEHKKTKQPTRGGATDPEFADVIASVNYLANRM